MPRSARMLIDGGTYHVLTRGNNGQQIFHDEMDYQRYLQLLVTYAQEHRLHIYHFALMPNHVHLVLEVPVSDTLSKAMLSVNLRYTLFYQRRYRYSGHLWQGRFKSLLIDRDSYLLECGRYVELNPVRAGLVKEPGAYAWSSYRVYAEGIDNPLIAHNPLYEGLGATARERQDSYRQFILNGIQRESATVVSRYGILDEPPTSTDSPWERFSSSLVGRKRGRPRKPNVAAEK